MLYVVLKRGIFPLLLLFALYWLSHNVRAQTTAQASEHLHIEASPQWISSEPLSLSADIPVDDISNGVFYQLVDRQLKVDKNGERSSYSRFVETIVNQTGVEDSSQINLDFDPAYERLSLNSLVVIRDGQRHDRLKDAKMAVFSRETELENQLYNGSLTLNILLDDVQVGDTLDYSYTREGANPIYRRLFAFSHSLNWQVPVYRQNIRVLWGKSSPLHIQSRNVQPDIRQANLGDYREYQIRLNNLTPVRKPSETPDWYSPYGRVYFSELGSWQEVIDWATPLYQFASAQPSVNAVAQQIAQEHGEQAAQITAALKYVQENIRYVGLEMGENSHLPTPPEETLALKYGDCKDKALLFIAILRALNIEAFPALVNTDNTKQLAELPPAMNVFDHVIVWLDFAGKSYWLDPTLNNQLGSLDNLYQPDYGYALILQHGKDSLTAMAKDESLTDMAITEKYRIPDSNDEAVMFSVHTTYTGYEAMSLLSKLQKKGKKTVAEDYQVYYQDTFQSLTATDDMTVTTDDQKGELTIDEYYQIPTFWKMGKKNWRADFYPTEIRNAVYKPEQSQRDGPLDFPYPNNIQQTLLLEFADDNWDFDNEQFEEDNAFFRYQSNVSFKNNILTVVYSFTAKTDHIPADKITDYLQARDRVRKDAYYGIYKKADLNGENASDSTENKPFSADWLAIIVCIYALGLLFIIAEWRIESGQRPAFEQSHFYPIAPLKFVLLSVISLGIYDCYWMYRNWKAVQQREQTDMLPFWRGFFVWLWIYPLYQQLKQHQATNPQPNKLMPGWLAALLALAYFICSFLGMFVDNKMSNLLFFVTPFLLLPFVRHINSLNQSEPQALRYNSLWRQRHYVAVLLFVPLPLFIAASETPLLPSDTVVSQSQLWQRDLKFFYRQKLLPANDSIIYFYSDAMLDIKSDGNGFSENQVFSYWKDDDGKLQTEVATYADIINIQVEFSDSDFDNTIITITRQDKSEFMLFVSNVDDGDRRFYDALIKQWKTKQLAL